MRLIQHKREAYWFYRFLSLGYDRWVNPLFWTPAMRSRALGLARLEHRTLRTLDVGAGTGFGTEGIVEHVAPEHVTMLDQSPHQLARSRAKPALERCARVLGDAEELPFPTDGFDRYVSTGSIEYWPDPQRAIAEAYRVLRPGGIALVAGPLPPQQRLARRLADTWMLFPTEEQYRAWFTRAGFEDVRVVHAKPEWHRGGPTAYGIAIAGMKPSAGPSPAAGAAPAGAERFSLRRFVAGSVAGAAFVPVAAALTLRHRLRR